MFKRSLLLVALFVFSGISNQATAAEPGWTWQVVTFGEKRAEIQSTPIVNRKYRPLHFYGNTIRRKHYHGVAVPTPQVVIEKLVR